MGCQRDPMLLVQNGEFIITWRRTPPEGRHSSHLHHQPGGVCLQGVEDREIRRSLAEQHLTLCQTQQNWASASGEG